MNTNTSTQLREANASQLGNASAAFGWAAAITALFNTVLALTKDYYSPLNKFMASLTGHHWITHGLADIILFFVLGLILLKTNLVTRINPAVLVACVLIASVGLVGWYLLF